MADTQGASIRFDLREVDAVRKMLANASLDTADRKRLLQGIGPEIEEGARERFQLQQSPDGDSWKALAQKTLDYYAKKNLLKNRKILTGEGFLQESITSEVQGDAWSVLVGAAREYAAVHQFGWEKKNIPARPYLGVSSDDAKVIENAVSVFLEGIIR